MRAHVWAPPRQCYQLAMDDLSHEMRGYPIQVLVDGLTFGGVDIVTPTGLRSYLAIVCLHTQSDQLLGKLAWLSQCSRQIYL